MQKFTFVLLFALASCTVFAQTDPSSTPADSAQNAVDTTRWKSGGFISLTFSQVSLSNSWAAGGSENISFTGATSLFANYTHDRTTWKTTLDMGYGQINQNNQGFAKSDDKLVFSSVVGHQLSKESKKWYLSGIIDFKTQFSRGYTDDQNGEDSLISNFMAPGYLTVGLGIDYQVTSKLSINYTPLTGKFTFVNDQRLADMGDFGVKAAKYDDNGLKVKDGRRARAELGSYLKIAYKDEVIKNVTVDERLELFSNYIVSFGTIDVNWQNTVVMQINKVLSANWFTNLIYDKDIKMEMSDGRKVAKVQWKSVFGVGLTYNFGAQQEKKS